MGTSSGASGETRYNWNEDMAPRWNTLLNSALWQTMRPDGNGGFVPQDRELYSGTRYAPLSSDQNEAGGYFREMNRQSSSPIGAMNAARTGIENTLNGKYLSGSSANPFGNTLNPLANANTVTDRNAFAGDNPYFRTALMNGMDDITAQYQKGTAADTTRMFNLAGAFGGSAHENAVANNEAALGKTLNNYASGMINDQFNRSAGLEDSFLGRDLQNQQFNKTGGLNAYESMFGRGSQNFENERNRMMGAIGSGQSENGLALDRGNALLNYGGLVQGNNQQNLDFLYDQWSQSQNYPFTMLNQLAGLYGQAMGGGGFNQSVYGGGGTSSWLPALGGLIGGYALGGR